MGKPMVLGPALTVHLTLVTVLSVSPICQNFCMPTFSMLDTRSLNYMSRLAFD